MTAVMSSGRVVDGVWTRMHKGRWSWHKVEKEKNNEQYPFSMVAEPWDRNPTAMMHHSSSAQEDEEDEEELMPDPLSQDDAMAELRARIDMVHAHHKFVQERLLLRVEALEAAAAEAAAAMQQESEERDEQHAINQRNFKHLDKKVL